MRLSILDQSPVSEGSTASQALRNTIDLARLADELGYHRYWLAEHHGGPMLAGPSPEALIGPVAAATERIRVGSGGVMLPHYSPFKVAETFSLLAGLFPGRIDLGIGRAAGTDPMTTFALQRDRRQAAPDDFPAAARRAARPSRGPAARRTTPSRGSPRPCPGDRRRPRSGCSAPRCRARSGPPSSDCPTPSRTSSTPAGRRPRASTASASPSTNTPRGAPASRSPCGRSQPRTSGPRGGSPPAGA